MRSRVSVVSGQCSGEWVTEAIASYTPDRNLIAVPRGQSASRISRYCVRPLILSNNEINGDLGENFLHYNFARSTS
jgi:hypothetical protein